ncbi:hypothetical protein [Marinimicrobium sp. ABcell2]|uniref:hypothetical protein n=1 Tax=Marinimicrobium sp. ABcell2 TaxID=3069751 RepID=UPI0027B0EC5B|nr:hypothetical protein [Marinimicrobium sp. ABcell2]MDQ2078538.1 hypothetical protein [Marinimicrobium sp. ABcell2]
MKYILSSILLIFSSFSFSGSTEISKEFREDFNESGFLSILRRDGEVAGFVVRKSANDKYLADAGILVVVA